MHGITALSKDLHGELRVEEESADACRDPECRTITAQCGVRAEIVPHAPCDDAPGFDGRLRAKVRFMTRDEPEGRVVDGKREGDRFQASYAMRLDVGNEPHNFHVNGAIEGALLRTCPQPA